MIFTKNFLNYNSKEIVESIQNDGYFAIEEALTEEFIKNIEQDVANHRFFINSNTLSGAYTNSQYFLVNMLACSKTFFDYCTSNQVLDICQLLIGDLFRLKALRYYESYSSTRMQWHTDSKTGFKFAPIPGLIFIAYISDVFDGEFQYVRGSHDWSASMMQNDFSDDLIMNNYASEIKSFKMKKGSIIVYNTHGIHRAKPSESENFKRKSLFFQVDGNDNSEPLLINPSYFNSLDDKLKMYLGFGRNATNTPFPYTDETTVPESEVKKLLLNLGTDRMKSS